MPKANGTRCAVAAVREWLELAQITEGSVFRAVSRSNRVLPVALSPQSVALIVKRAAARIGANADEFSGHSLRACFCTEGSGWPCELAASCCYSSCTRRASCSLCQTSIKQNAKPSLVNAQLVTPASWLCNVVSGFQSASTKAAKCQPTHCAMCRNPAHACNEKDPPSWLNLTNGDLSICLAKLCKKTGFHHRRSGSLH